MFDAGEHTESIRGAEIQYSFVQFISQKNHSDAVHREYNEKA